MKNKVEIKSSAYFVENINRAIVLTDECANEYRIIFIEGGGININKLGGENLTDQIMIASRTTNEIHLF